MNAFEPLVLISDEAAYGVDYALQHNLETLLIHVFRMYLGGVPLNAANVFAGKIPESEWVVLVSHGLTADNDPEEPTDRMRMGFFVGGTEFELTPRNIPERVKLRGRKIMALGCGNGRAPFGQAFLEAGCPVYIGANESVDQTATQLFASLFFYHLINPNGTPLPPHGRPSRIYSEREAFERAASVDDEFGKFRFYARA
ncbi:MAG: hypothetical protein AMXMBFR7_50100 [Planctomycetota bacterium]